MEDHICFDWFGFLGRITQKPRRNLTFLSVISEMILLCSQLLQTKTLTESDTQEENLQYESHRRDKHQRNTWGPALDQV